MSIYDKKGIIHINDIRKKKGLEPVENINSYFEDDIDQHQLYSFSVVDIAYDDYIEKSLSAKNDEDRFVYFREFVDIFAKRFNEVSIRIIDELIEKSPLKEVIDYAYEGSGKRLRPLLMYIIYRSCDGFSNDDLMDFMIAIELLHSYSLIHDDLPCMDNDEIRRGKPSVWKQFGEANAILAGDSMINLSQEIAGYSVFTGEDSQLEYMKDFLDEVNGYSDITLDAGEVENMLYGIRLNYASAKSLQILSKASGSLGMVAGQVLDLKYESSENVTKDDIITMYGYKTGCLISACLTIGYELSIFSDSDELMYELDDIGKVIGVMYQIKDDIDDVTLSTEKLGKPSHSDEKNSKNTYVSLAGLDNAKKDLSDLNTALEKMLNNISEKGIKTRSIKDFIYFIFNK